MSLMFWRLGVDDDAIYNRLGAYWFVCLISCTSAYQASLLVFVEMRSVYLKER